MLSGIKLLKNKQQNICIIPNPSTRLSTGSNLFSVSTEMQRKLKNWDQYPAARATALLLSLVFGRKQVLDKGHLFSPKLSVLPTHTNRRYFANSILQAQQ